MKAAEMKKLYEAVNEMLACLQEEILDTGSGMLFDKLAELEQEYGVKFITNSKFWGRVPTIDCRQRQFAKMDPKDFVTNHCELLQTK